MKAFNQRELRITLKRTEQAQFLLRFLQNKGVRLKKLHITDKQITFIMTKNHLPIFRIGRKKYRVKASIRYLKPDKILQKDVLTVMGVALLICMPLLFLQFVWKIDVESPIVEVEDQLKNYLQDELNIRTPIQKSDLPNDVVLRQLIMQQFREFSWVHIAKEGSHVTITPEFAPKADVEESERRPLYLIAANNGVITHFNIEYGERKVKPNMTVYKGDLLVSGIIGEGEERVVVGAKGDVFADYWLETSFSVPRTIEYDRIAEQMWQWTWNPRVFLYVLEQKSPLLLKELLVFEKHQKIERVAERLEPQHIEERILPLLHEKILRSLPQKSSIKSENLLHVTFDDDTVKGKVLFFVNENIATPDHAGQGD